MYHNVCQITTIQWNLCQSASLYLSPFTLVAHNPTKLLVSFYWTNWRIDLFACNPYLVLCPITKGEMTPVLLCFVEA